MKRVMVKSMFFESLTFCMATFALSSDSTVRAKDFLEPLQPQVAAAVAAVNQLPADRQELLLPVAERIAKQLREQQKAKLIFICTANSRRSQLGQVWGKIAAVHYGLDGIETYSGGTQATACNLRTVRALQRAGLEVAETAPGENPRYEVRFAKSEPAIGLYSKRYDDDANPREGFIAMVCCDDADDACPTVTGAVARARLSYADPKAADGTPNETAAYDERSRQIAAEMFFLMRAVAQRM